MCVKGFDFLKTTSGKDSGVQKPKTKPVRDSYATEADYKTELENFYTMGEGGAPEARQKFESEWSTYMASKAQAERAGPVRPARAVMFDARGAQRALARSRRGSVSFNTLGMPGAAGAPRGTLLGGGGE
jgi:hypothetical protein